MKYPARFENVAASVSKYGERVHVIGKHLWTSDPLADDAVEALITMGGRGFATFERAAKEGVLRVPEAPVAFRRFFEFAEEVPSWADFNTIDRGGQLLFRAHMLGGLVLAFRSIILGYVSPAGNKPLVFSGRLQDDTVRRLIETSKFVYASCMPGSLQRFGEAYQITLKVRLMHAKVRRMLLQSPTWNKGAWGTPINQHDMAATSLLFSLEVVDGLRSLGFSLTPEEIEAYFQLWKYSSHLMGVSLDLLVGSEPEAWRLRQVIEATEGSPDDDARALADSLVHAGVRGARSREERDRAARMLPLNRALVHHLIGEKLAVQLGIRNSRVRYALPVLVRTVERAEAARLRMPGATSWAVLRGKLYWKQIVDMGLFGAAAQFAPPETLAKIVA